MPDPSNDLAAMRAGRDCVSTLAEAFGRSCSHRSDQLLEAVGLLRRLAEEVETLGVGAALVAQARAFADDARVEEIRAFVKPRDVLRWNELADPYHLAHVREARRDPGHPLHAIVKWVEAPVEAERDRLAAELALAKAEIWNRTQDNGELEAKLALDAPIAAAARACLAAKDSWEHGARVRELFAIVEAQAKGGV